MSKETEVKQRVSKILDNLQRIKGDAGQSLITNAEKDAIRKKIEDAGDVEKDEESKVVKKLRAELRQMQNVMHDYKCHIAFQNDVITKLRIQLDKK